ncbi:carbamoyltransferase C-terminal domain-containing protein [Bradyrhizobium sp. USDA 4452]
MGDGFASQIIRQLVNSLTELIRKQMQCGSRAKRDYVCADAYLGPSYSDRGIVGWFQGRIEWRPQALGNRSLLAAPPQQSGARTDERESEAPQALPPFLS